MRRQAHIFLTTSDDDVRIAAHDCLCCQMYGFQTAATDLVNGHAGYGVRKTRCNASLAGRVLACTCGQNLTEDQLVDLIGFNAGLF